MVEHRTRFWSLLRISLFALALVPGTASGQGPTGTVTGRVTDTQGAAIPGVTIELQSPAIQGVQRRVTDDTGTYIFRLLPPGTYSLTFQIPGFATEKVTRSVAAAEPVRADVELRAASVTENVTVIANPLSFINSIEGATNIRQSLLDTLPTTRDPLAAVSLAPAAHSTGPNGNFSIAGAMSFENLYLINGVVAQDNVRGDPLTLYVEDAIQETAIISSGVSAEFGRFSGGIINVTTKSGGNAFSGSFRTTFTNDSWRTTTPLGESKLDKTVPAYETTFGGPISRDRLWFFLAAYSKNNELARETGYTAQPFTRTTDERRYEAKGTIGLAAGHRLSVDYLGLDLSGTNSAWPSTAEVMDLASLTNPKNPQSQVVVNYSGSLSSRLFLEVQGSARMLTFEDSGGLNTELTAGTPLRDLGTGAWWWAPNFCGVCAPEERNNTNVLVKGSYFLSNGSGSHNVVFGYDGFDDRMRADNHQSATDYHVWAASSIYENGVIYPIIVPGGNTYIIHWPLQQNAQHTSFKTHGLFANDSWWINRNLTVNLGLRFDKNAGRDSAGALVANDSAFSPRLGVAFDPMGDGRTSLTASFARYVSAISNPIAGSASPAGNPSIIAAFYDGEPINTGDGPLVPSDVALQRVFDWYFANNPDPFVVDIPGIGKKINGSLKSPRADEVSFGVSRQLTSRAAVRLDFVNRAFSNFYSRRIDTTTGIVSDEFGQQFDLALVENTNDLERRYRALNLQAGYNGTDLTLGGSYTLSRLSGNEDGENAASGPLDSDVAAYPEYRQLSWFAPEGDLSADQRHRARLWAAYRLPWGRGLFDTTVSAIQVLQSGTPYGAVGSALVIPFVDDVGYVLPPEANSYFFTARDAFRTEASAWTNFQISIDRRLGSRGPSLFARFQIFNLFNQFSAHDNTNSQIDTTIITAYDGLDNTLDFFDPFTETPVEGVHWKKGPQFGQPVARTGYNAPRTFEFSVGVKF